MECEVTGRPCCIGTQAQCIITSQDYCAFKGGVYHKDKTLCSQVKVITWESNDIRAYHQNISIHANEIYFLNFLPFCDTTNVVSFLRNLISINKKCKFKFNRQYVIQKIMVPPVLL